MSNPISMFVAVVGIVCGISAVVSHDRRVTISGSLLCLSGALLSIWLS